MPSAPLDESRLEDEGLLIAQLAARGPPLLGVLRRVNPAIGSIGVDEIVCLAHMRGQRIGDVRRAERFVLYMGACLLETDVLGITP